MKVTLRQIEGFLAVADTLSFSRGAQKLHVTQSAFSQKEILTIARRMAEAGEIVLGAKGGEEMV